MKHFQPVGVPSVLMYRQSKSLLYTIIPSLRLVAGILLICPVSNLLGINPLVLDSKAVHAPFLTVNRQQKVDIIY
ncbi:hypothetical protein [Chryseobacterium sp. 5_R23647]|uniref:hypothetical protein n=1 Tax=Chryseobacterium sp. 5_R23647 TaxID=2258964 RepID=UPI000F50FC0E|nr:hypothetical protein [Chryseobacterium sp. 5_R23647]